MSRLILVLLLAGLGACSSSKQPEITPPSHILGRDSFLLMLTEVQLIEGVSKQRLLRNDDEEALLTGHYAELFQRFDISESTFLESYRWWYTQPAAMDALLQEAAEALTAMERISVQSETDERKR
tara:strand:- start:3672 stop:4046 length:375 start_codon:yes stop_codon:yes gene_type:complete